MTGKPIYAVGDIHGQRAMLEDALARIERDSGADARVVFLGDLVDRGPDSRGVIELLSQGVAAGRDWTVLRGNHDRLYSYFLRQVPCTDPQILVGYQWLHERIGGVETLRSYGIEVPAGMRHYQLLKEALAVIPQAHLNFMDSLPTHLEAGELLFVHAGIRPGLPLEQQSEDDMLWIRDEFLDYKEPHPWLVVHGHTPERRPVHMGNRVNLDSGAGFGRPLTTAVFEGRRCWILGDRGREPLTP
ncbi:serine/threonine protein phosphatase 1 [Salinihabitans flavidus]|uniref:Serine/threonine protein phosphatase 1 n=1 Tax=Salinihabitans flavidus TaxID=569882 RepID=A0A1H8LLY1_9RHOB|nr:metallophosphoesterase family protein [Salinihabitans flavidus]SEO06161.1 serine/threonine protein phosphatase 1 [Salinihabitans flavidus]